jgi:nitrogen fixation protein NifQ
VTALAKDLVDPAQWIYRELMSGTSGEGNAHVLACMIASWQTGGGAMPDWLGLPPAAFRCLMDHHFPSYAADLLSPLGRKSSPGRAEEGEDLVGLMLLNKAGESPSEVWMAQSVAVGCLGSDHLWQDLGLWSRADLSQLMRRNFPALAARNVRDMKWKRFLYKQLCEAEGIYICRAPSCEICIDYDACFGPEH